MSLGFGSTIEQMKFLEDGPEMRVLALNDMNGEILATPAIADGRLYIRTKEKLFCVGK